jgi:hypothetical protein
VCLASAGFVTLLFACLPGSAHAANIPITLTTSPVTLDLHIAPGTSTTQTLEFQNGSSIPLPVSMATKVFGAYGSIGEAAITNPKPGDLSTTWVTFSPSYFVAQPNVWNSVKMTISLPRYASLGYYYAILFKPTIPNSPSGSSTTQVKGSNAILVLVDSNTGNEKRSSAITNFSANKHVYDYLPVTFSTTIRNTGNIYLAPQGDVFISRHSNMSDSIATIPFNHAGANVLPQTNRIFTSSWSNGFPVYIPKELDGVPVNNSKNLPEYTLSWNWHNTNNFRFGKYYARIVLTYNDGTSNKIIQSEVSFWIIPWPIILVGLILLALMATGVYTIGRFSGKRIHTKANKLYKR